MPAALLRSLRIHQWTKNALLLVPLVTSHRVWPLDWAAQGLLALGSFSLCASATYILNDLLDREADRAHPTKRHRPLASGAISPGAAGALAVVSLCAGLALAWPLGAEFAVTLGAYLVLTVAYSLWLKRVALLDVIVLASLYSLRVIAGHIVFGIAYSEWLLAFTVFLFLGLALLKRYAELLLLRGDARAEQAGSRRGYTARDIALVGQIGTACSVVAVLVFALYINSERVRVLYRYPDALWLAIPLLLYWLGRVWRIAHHGEMDADPVLFALRDALSYTMALLFGAILLAASGWPG